MTDVLRFMAVDDGREDTCDVAVRFGFVELTGLDERRKHGPVLCASIVTGENALDGIFVHLDVIVNEKQNQAIPVFGNVFECCACWGPGRHLWGKSIMRSMKAFATGGDCLVKITTGVTFKDGIKTTNPGQIAA
ncbi:MAG: hypothetical protein ACJA1E_002169 [Paracoccaceae bacterium]|jgi:hypothetical protein